tara:strand:+ start:725 stop:2164 length:1440 start_codon:yes stop_codon:yes gene_type:complete
MINIIQNTIGALGRTLNIVRKNLQLWLDFERSNWVGGDLVVKDKSPNTNNAKLFTGKALSFNGNDSVVLSSDITLTDEFTIAFNIYKSTDGVEMALGNTTLSNKVGYLNNGKYFIRVVNGGSSDNTISFDLSQWSRVVITRDSSNKVDISINGSSKVRLFSDSAQAGNSVWNEFGTSNGIQYLNGNLSDLQIYNKAWTASDVAFDYNNPNHLAIDNPDTDLVVTDLKGYWAMSEGDGLVAYDSSGEGNNGTITGATYTPAQDTIPQLGMMDWVKSTPVADEVTLIQAPNNKGYDILGNALRLREHAFNLDGTGYGEVLGMGLVVDNFSFEAWVKLSDDDFLMAESVIMESSGSLFMFGGTMTYIRAVNGGFTSQIVSHAFAPNVWYHIVVTRIKNGNQIMYIDGSLTNTATAPNTTINLDNATIGKDSTTRISKSIQDETKIYNRALTQKEITQNYKAGINKHKASSSFSDDFSSDYGI